MSIKELEALNKSFSKLQARADKLADKLRSIEYPSEEEGELRDVLNDLAYFDLEDVINAYVDKKEGK